MAYVFKRKFGLKKVLGSTVLILITALLITIAYNFKFSCSGYKCLVFPDKNLWSVKEKFDETNKSWRGLIADPNYLVRLYKVGGANASEADNFTQLSTMKIMGLFDTARSPYPGEISDKIVCYDKFIPTQEDFISSYGVKIHYSTAYLTDRMQYGACTDAQITYKVFSGMFYCQNVAEWYQIELITPVNSAQSSNFYKNLFLHTGCSRSW